MGYSDTQLRSYLDGSLEPQEAEALERRLEADPELEAQLLAMETLRPVVGRAFETVPSDRRLEALMPDASQPAAPTRRFFLAGGIAAASGAVGFGLANLTAPVPAALGWQEQVAIYQALYGPQTVQHIDIDAKALDAQFARASAALGREISAEDVSAVDGLDLRRAQILSFEGTPLVQIVFASDAGMPVAFCILSLANNQQKAPQLRTLSGLQTAHWSDGQFGYMVLGDIDVAMLTRITDKLSATF